MAGTVVLTETPHTAPHMCKFAWTSSAGGAADKVSVEVYTGVLWSVAFIPGTGGTQPTDLYDVTITDASSVDLLQGYGANLSNAAQSTVTLYGAVVQSTLTLAVTNAGNAKTGTVVLYII